MLRTKLTFNFEMYMYTYCIAKTYYIKCILDAQQKEKLKRLRRYLKIYTIRWLKHCVYRVLSKNFQLKTAAISFLHQNYVKIFNQII